MAWFNGSLDEDRLTRCEGKATEIRKLLFGALLLAKDSWKTGLEQEHEGVKCFAPLLMPRQIS